jgi:broad specificity phosphatase PhoE
MSGRGDNLPAGPTRWWWVRHAPVPNRKGRIFGHMDVDADTSGHAHFRALAAALPESALWFVSPLRRTRQTALAIGAAGRDWLGRPVPELSFEADLAEQNYGIWQGLTRAEIAALSGMDEDVPWQKLALMTPPQGESFSDLTERVERVIKRITHSHPGRDIVAVAHAGTIRAAVGHALGIGPGAALSFPIDPLSLTRLDYDPPAKATMTRKMWGRGAREWQVGPVGQSPTVFSLS